MKIHIYDRGEFESNINPNEMTIELNHDIKDYDEQERKMIRINCSSFARDIFDFMNDCEVRFDDECPDCYHKMIDNQCVNDKCLNVR